MRTAIYLAVFMLPLSTGLAQAGWGDLLDTIKESVQKPAQESASPATSRAAGEQPTESETIAGLREALRNGTEYAVSSLGKDGGFLNNANVRIPMPSSLSWVEKTLRTLRQDRLADEFVASMNHAAEQAVPEAAAVFGDAINRMTLDDARGILTGPDDAATQYFRRTTSADLTARMRPIVEQATSRTGVTSS